MSRFNKILIKQIKKNLGKDFKIPKEFQGLFNDINTIYDLYEKQNGNHPNSKQDCENVLSLEKNSQQKYQKEQVVKHQIKEPVFKVKSTDDPLVKLNLKDGDLVSIADQLREKIKLTEILEEKLRVSGLKLQAIIENTEDVIWSVDEYFRLYTFNSSFKKKIITKYKVEPFQGDPLQNVMSLKDFIQLEVLLERAMDGERFSIEECIKEDDMDYYYETSYNPIVTDGKITGISVFSRNITFRKEEERKKNQLLKDVKTANKDLEQIAYIAAHDLRTPLRSIGSIASWIKTDYDNVFDENTRIQIDILIERVNRLYNLIESISQYMSLKNYEGEKQKVDIGYLIKEVIQKVEPPKNIKIEIANKLPKIIVIKNHLATLFEYLIENSIKYMDKKEGLVKIKCLKRGDFWVFYVSDNGPGIEKKYFDKIFQVFQTLESKDERESKGIGLAIVKKIVEMNGGAISVKSQMGHGSTFKFTILDQG